MLSFCYCICNNIEAYVSGPVLTSCVYFTGLSVQRRTVGWHEEHLQGSGPNGGTTNVFPWRDRGATQDVSMRISDPRPRLESSSPRKPGWRDTAASACSTNWFLQEILFQTQFDSLHNSDSRLSSEKTRLFHSSSEGLYCYCNTWRRLAQTKSNVLFQTGIVARKEPAHVSAITSDYNN